MTNQDTSAYDLFDDEEVTLREEAGSEDLRGREDGAYARAHAEDAGEEALFEEQFSTDGNLAVQLEPSEDEIFVYEHEAEQENVVLREIRTKKERRSAKNGILFKASLLIVLGLIAGLRFASITEINYRNQALSKELGTIQSESVRKRVEIDSAMSITKVAELAEERLGMQNPQAYQIRYVEVEKIDQTELHNVELTREDSEIPWYEQVKNAIMKFLGIVEN